jgi:hypothetical protein
MAILILVRRQPASPKKCGRRAADDHTRSYVIPERCRQFDSFVALQCRAAPEMIFEPHGTLSAFGIARGRRAAARPLGSASAAEGNVSWNASAELTDKACSRDHDLCDERGRAGEEQELL